MADGEREKDSLDALAYVDGELDVDLSRKADIERRMRRCPELSDKVRAFRLQNEALCRAYDAHLRAPVPKRLFQILDREEPHSYRQIARAATIAFMLLSAGAIGWLLGRDDPESAGTTTGFVERSYQHYTAALSNLHMAGGPQASLIAPGKISLSWRVPDLEPLGYKPIDLRTVVDNGTEMVRLTYLGADGETVALFLRPRGRENELTVKLTDRDGVALAYWVEGSVVSVLAAQMPRSQLLAIANKVRPALSQPNLQQPSAPVHRDELITELPVPEAKIAPDSPPLPTSHRAPTLPN